MNRLAFLSKELNPICCSAQFMCSLERLEFPQCCALVEINSKTNNSWAVWGEEKHCTEPLQTGMAAIHSFSVHGRVSVLGRAGEISLVPHQPVCLRSEPAEPAGKSIESHQWHNLVCSGEQWHVPWSPSTSPSVLRGCTSLQSSVSTALVAF